MTLLTRLLTLLLILGVCQQLGAQYQQQTGELHPDFTLPNLATGKPVSLSDLRGQKVLLIHFASW